MLYLIGVGLRDEKDITLRGLETAKSCENLYIELYTSKWLGKENLEALVGKPVQELDRKGMEENVKQLLEESRLRDVAVFVPGDPFVATTHTALMLEAQKLGVDVRAIHAPSIYSAIAASGLSIYKFGKTVTIPRVQEGYEPTSFYDIITDNLRVGAHTLCLLDVGAKPMAVREALERLEAAETIHKRHIIGTQTMLVAASFGDTDTIVYAPLTDFKNRDFPVPAVLVLPAQLNDVERELLETKRY